MRIFSTNEVRTAVSLLTEIPERILFRPGLPAYSQLSGEYMHIGCLACANPPCLYFDENSVLCKNVADFPSDRNNLVCPVNALSWDKENCRPVVDNYRCIACGVCMRRCPVGAIFFDNGVRINYKPCACQHESRADSNVLAAHRQQIQQLFTVTRHGRLIEESDSLFSRIYDRLFRTKSSNHNLIGRNLLISLGCHAATRRIGDVYTRMDAIYTSPDNLFGAVEIEFGRDTLDASRGILDDIAILQTRYQIPKEFNQPLVICLQLPNARQGYWQVVKDVKTVERIIIETVTIGSLMILNWNGSLLLPDDGTYYFDYDEMNLRKAIEEQISRRLNISYRHLGILEPIK